MFYLGITYIQLKSFVFQMVAGTSASGSHTQRQHEKDQGRKGPPFRKDAQVSGGGPPPALTKRSLMEADLFTPDNPPTSANKLARTAGTGISKN